MPQKARPYSKQSYEANGIPGFAGDIWLKRVKGGRLFCLLRRFEMAFPRTTVAGVSLPRLLIGSNWIFGWSHTGHAADVYIKKYHSMVDATLSVLNAFLEYGIDAWMAPFSSHPDALDKIKRIPGGPGKAAAQSGRPE